MALVLTTEQGFQRTRRTVWEGAWRDGSQTRREDKQRDGDGRVAAERIPHGHGLLAVSQTM